MRTSTSATPPGWSRPWSPPRSRSPCSPCPTNATRHAATPDRKYVAERISGFFEKALATTVIDEVPNLTADYTSPAETAVPRRAWRICLAELGASPGRHPVDGCIRLAFVRKMLSPASRRSPRRPSVPGGSLRVIQATRSRARARPPRGDHHRLGLARQHGLLLRVLLLVRLQPTRPSPRAGGRPIRPSGCLRGSSGGSWSPGASAALFTFWFTGFYMSDDDLGKDHTDELMSDIREGVGHE